MVAPVRGTVVTLRRVDVESHGIAVGRPPRNIHDHLVRQRPWTRLEDRTLGVGVGSLRIVWAITIDGTQQAFDDVDDFVSVDTSVDARTHAG